jgi:pentose-5-phosphate-3-epimerase
VGPANAADIRKAGAQILVAGSSVFRASDPAAAVAALRA